MALVRDEGVARTVGAKESIELPDLGVEGGKLMSRISVGFCEIRCCGLRSRLKLKEEISAHAFQVQKW
jgi:hypothetical protein